MPDFSPRGEGGNPRNQGVSRPSQAFFHPLGWEKNHFNVANAINDSNAVRQGDLLVWMNGNAVKRNPGHIAVVESYVPQCMVGGNMRVVEATGAGAANPKLLDSMYSVEQIINKGKGVPAMILVVKRHGKSGSRVPVIRV